MARRVLPPSVFLRHMENLRYDFYTFHSENRKPQMTPKRSSDHEENLSEFMKDEELMTRAFDVTFDSKSDPLKHFEKVISKKEEKKKAAEKTAAAAAAAAAKKAAEKTAAAAAAAAAKPEGALEGEEIPDDNDEESHYDFDDPEAEINAYAYWPPNTGPKAPAKHHVSRRREEFLKKNSRPALRWKEAMSEYMTLNEKIKEKRSRGRR
eukprot:CAMPEP_0177683954 /NCGR_PEP_ID=MMETSP0447-20121125/32133_1 /TAXON_ID=0 /ORGANISM="Stygamoeba regulata, Strain BSH-02190019" /LENGTH=207 /DNA_ID=CAMNT_0019193689 /DNA_START=21 /DNA_END=647 /DNA_ORIENTATION=-